MSFISYVPKSTISSSNFGGYRSRTQPKQHRVSASSSNTFVSIKNTDQPIIKPKSKKITTSTPTPILSKPNIVSDDFNMLIVDTQIREYLISKMNTLPSLRNELKITLKLTSSTDITQQIMASERVNTLRRIIKDIESTMEIVLYDLRVSKIINEYRKLSKLANNKSFICEDVDKSSKTKLQELKRHFLSVSREYVDISIARRKIHKTMICEECGSNDMHVNIEDDSMYTCGVCFSETEILIDTPSFKDTDRVNLTNKYIYSRRGHFMDAVKRYQGIQNVDSKKIENAVEIINQEMKHHSLVSERFQPNSVNMDHIYMFLCERSLRNHYDDLQLLNNIITGEECPDISHLEDVLYSKFDELEKALSQIEDDIRINSLNVDYKLYKLLQHLEWRCSKDQFYILKTKNKEDEHDEKMKKAFEILGWKWIPTF